jgi:hypothetical protein
MCFRDLAADRCIEEESLIASYHPVNIAPRLKESDLLPESNLSNHVEGIVVPEKRSANIF